MEQLASPLHPYQQILDTSPYNGLGYGLALFIMFLFAILMFRRSIVAENYSKNRDEKILEFNHKWLEFMVKMQYKLDENTTLLHETNKRIVDESEERDGQFNSLVAQIKNLIELMEKHHKNQNQTAPAHSLPSKK